MYNKIIIYLSKSQCIFDIRKPGNVNRDPSNPHQSAKKNFNTICDAGPLLK